MLSANQRVEFARRAPSEVLSAFNRLQPHWNTARWLGVNNRYRSDCVRRVNTDFSPGRVPIHKHLSEYVAASTAVHCLDGWAYLGRALHALLVGDHDAARHLGYYAELRAAISLLASEGVGVFNRRHIIVSQRGRCLRMPNQPTTHVFTWEALEEWATSPGASAHVLQMISGGGHSLAEWMNHVGQIPAFLAQLARDWLLGWGMDISQLAEDRESRNLASYRPTSLTTGRPLDARSVSQFVSALWPLCEPREQNPFSTLDRLLIRSSLQRAFKAAHAHGRTALSASRQFAQFIENNVLAGLQPNEVPGVNWTSFLTEINTGVFNVLALAAAKDPPTRPWHAVQVAARAFLLLRIATGSCERMFSQLPGGAIVGLNFWVDQIGEDRGLWQQNAKPAASVDLWTDAEDAVEEIAQNLAAVDSFHSLWETFPKAAEMLSSWERVCLWGLRL